MSRTNRFDLKPKPRRCSRCCRLLQSDVRVLKCQLIASRGAGNRAASAVDPKMAVANRVAKHGETEPPPATRSRGSSLHMTCMQLCALDLQTFPLLHKRLIVLAISHHKKSEPFPNNDKAGGNSKTHHRTVTV